MERIPGDPLLALVQWTLGRLLRGEYQVTLDDHGNPEHLGADPNYGGRSVETIEENLKACLPWTQLEKLFALRNERTVAQVGVALAEFPFLGLVLGTAAFEDL